MFKLGKTHCTNTLMPAAAGAVENRHNKAGEGSASFVEGYLAASWGLISKKQQS